MLLLLFALFVTARGLELSGITVRAARRLGRGRLLAFELTAMTYLLSAAVTNDVALLVMVPLTLALDTDRKDLLVVLEALAANAGAALTPVGSPQHLFIYWFYHVPPLSFLACTLPLSLPLLTLLLGAALCVRPRREGGAPGDAPPLTTGPALLHGAGFLLVTAVVLRLLPAPWALLAPATALLFDRKSLRVDYALLLTFLFFFGTAENLKLLLAARLDHAEHIFLLSALSSQVMSNVPATLLLAKFTDHWEALLWGANVGGFGSLVGSLANLIAYKLYVSREAKGSIGAFSARFLLLGYAFFLAGAVLYYLRYVWTGTGP